MAFGTFAYADGEFIDNGNGIQIVDFQKSAKRDESSALAALLTAVLRPNFHIAPGILVSAAEVSGAGVGKGKFVHSICEVAFGHKPKAVSYGGSVQEFEKRLGSSLIESPSCCFFDNVNGTTVKSDALASFLSENPSAMRLLGTNKLEQTSAPSLMCFTGNSVTLSEDLARRFIEIHFDARVEDPEMRKFESDVCADIARSCRSLLADTLTIWRWGRQMGLIAERRLGGYELWSDWVIAPLVKLGCADPLTRIAETKQRDPARMRLSSVFAQWWEAHGDEPVTIKNLDKSVKDLIRPDQSLQYYTRTVPSYVGTRIAGFILEQIVMPGKWSATKYVLRKTVAAAGNAPEPDTPMTPMIPMTQPSLNVLRGGSRTDLLTRRDSQNIGVIGVIGGVGKEEEEISKGPSYNLGEPKGWANGEISGEWQTSPSPRAYGLTDDGRCFETSPTSQQSPSPVRRDAASLSNYTTTAANEEEVDEW